MCSYRAVDINCVLCLVRMARVEDDECAVTFELNESDLPTSLRFNEVSAAEHAGAAPESEEEGACGGSGTAGVQRPLGTLCNRQGTR